jgi:hypothetical protein
LVTSFWFIVVISMYMPSSGRKKSGVKYCWGRPERSQAMGKERGSYSQGIP